MTPAVLAVDVGGTKIASAIIAQNASILWSDTSPTHAGEETSGAERLRQVVIAALNSSGVEPKAIGIAIPAVLDRMNDSVLWAPNLPSWNGLDMRSTLRSVLPVPVAIEYDGQAAAIGEGWAGAGVGVDDFVVVTVGTGIGCGLVVNGSVVRGRSRLAGAAGWMVLAEDGSSWEFLATSRGIYELLREALDHHPRSPLADVADPGPEAVFEAFKTGDPAAVETIDNLARRLGLGIANIVSLLNPSRIILTGGIGSHGAALLPGIVSTVGEYAQPVASQDLEILTSPLDSPSTLFGAAKSALCAMEDDHSVDEKG
ncbi:MAG TPA: ROK family protein [Actinobacteria bacterium]|nr:ROK family protein [Actinomycetota bacterium]